MFFTTGLTLYIAATDLKTILMHVNHTSFLGPDLWIRHLPHVDFLKRSMSAVMKYKTQVFSVSKTPNLTVSKDTTKVFITPSEMI